MVPSQSGQYHVFWEIAEYAAFNCFSQVIQKSFNEAKWILLQELDKERLIARFIFAAAEFHDQRLKDTGGTQIDFELSKLFEFFFAKDGANALTACAELIRALPTLLRPGAEKGSSRVYADFEAKALKIISSQPFADSLQTIRI